MAPKGKLISIGGSEDKGTEAEGNFVPKNNLNFFELQILRRIKDEMRNEDPLIEVITTASSIPTELGEGYEKAFSRLGCTRINLMHIREREDAKNPEYIKRIEEADGVMFTGGNQLRLSMIFGGSTILKILQERYLKEDFVIAGTSAGAMAMSSTMIYQGSSSEALLKGEVKITTGLAFIKDVIIDSHFVKRGRFGRLAHAVASNPSCIGIGLGEDTGVLVTEGENLEAIGSGLILIFDGHEIKHTNIAEVQDGSPISIERMIVHVMAKGNHYNLNTHQFFATKEVKTKV